MAISTKLIALLLTVLVLADGRRSTMRHERLRKRHMRRIAKSEKHRQQRTVVAGLAYGKTFGRGLVKVFVGSLRNCGYEGDIIMGIAPDQDAEVLEYYTKHRVTVKVVPPEHGLELAFLRFYHYAKWLEEYNDDDLVLFADTKDVYFQKPPFADPRFLTQLNLGVDLMFFEEFGNTIDSEPHNQAWVLGCWGATGLFDVADK